MRWEEIPFFKPEGREGNRVGYWCPTCKMPFTIDQGNVLAGVISWEETGYGMQGTHRKCGTIIESIMTGRGF